MPKEPASDEDAIPTDLATRAAWVAQRRAAVDTDEVLKTRMAVRDEKTRLIPQPDQRTKLLHRSPKPAAPRPPAPPKVAAKPAVHEPLPQPAPRRTATTGVVRLLGNYAQIVSLALVAVILFLSAIIVSLLSSR